jgi:acyl-CoA thioester hydrolase
MSGDRGDGPDALDASGNAAPTDLATGRPTDRRLPFRYSALARVWFSDTDAQGVVYYGRYLPYFDHARLEYHRHLGLLGHWAGSAEFVMRALSVEYEAPARFVDLREVFVRTSRIGRTSIETECAAYRVADDTLMCTARLALVLIETATRRPTRVPDAYRQAIAAFEGPSIEGAFPA